MAKESPYDEIESSPGGRYEACRISIRGPLQLIEGLFGDRYGACHIGIPKVFQLVKGVVGRWVIYNKSSYMEAVGG